MVDISVHARRTHTQNDILMDVSLFDWLPQFTFKILANIPIITTTTLRAVWAMFGKCEHACT